MTPSFKRSLKESIKKREEGQGGKGEGGGKGKGACSADRERTLIYLFEKIPFIARIGLLETRRERAGKETRRGGRGKGGGNALHGNLNH